MPDEKHEEPHALGRDGDESPHGDEPEDDIEELRRRIEALQVDADKRLRTLAKERPFLMLGAAVAVGFILGRAMRRL